MKQLDALRVIKTKPYYTPEVYLDIWQEFRMRRHAILTPTDVIGWGPSWEHAITDADRQWLSKKLDGGAK